MRFLTDYLQRHRAHANPTAGRSPLLDRLSKTEMSDFGRQVVMQMALTPDEFKFSRDVRTMYHDVLGLFVLQADGTMAQEGSAAEFGERKTCTQRALTVADQSKIMEEMVTLLQRPITVPERTATAFGAGISPQTQYEQTIKSMFSKSIMDGFNESHMLDALNYGLGKGLIKTRPPVISGGGLENIMAKLPEED